MVSGSLSSSRVYVCTAVWLIKPSCYYSIPCAAASVPSRGRARRGAGAPEHGQLRARVPFHWGAGAAGSGRFRARAASCPRTVPLFQCQFGLRSRNHKYRLEICCCYIRCSLTTVCPEQWKACAYILFRLRRNGATPPCGHLDVTPARVLPVRLPAGKKKQHRRTKICGFGNKGHLRPL